MEWYASLLGLGSVFSGAALLARQWRLRKRDHEDFLLRSKVLDHVPTAHVLGNLAAVRRAERSSIALTQGGILGAPGKSG